MFGIGKKNCRLEQINVVVSGETKGWGGPGKLQSSTYQQALATRQTPPEGREREKEKKRREEGGRKIDGQIIIFPSRNCHNDSEQNTAAFEMDIWTSTIGTTISYWVVYKRRGIRHSAWSLVTMSIH